MLAIVILMKNKPFLKKHLFLMGVLKNLDYVPFATILDAAFTV